MFFVVVASAETTGVRGGEVLCAHDADCGRGLQGARGAGGETPGRGGTVRGGEASHLAAQPQPHGTPHPEGELRGQCLPVLVLVLLFRIDPFCYYPQYYILIPHHHHYQR